MKKSRRIETLCPEHMRRHMLIVGERSGDTIAQCPSEGVEWDVIQERRRGLILDLESRRRVVKLLAVGV